MRVCLTVQGEQPMSWATSPMVSGGPSGAPVRHRMGPGSRRNGPGWPGQCVGQHWPREEREKRRVCAGLADWGTRAFGEEAELFLILGLGGLMAMIVGSGFGTSEQFGEQSLQEVRKLGIEMPEQGEQESGNDGLK